MNEPARLWGFQQKNWPYAWLSVKMSFVASNLFFPYAFCPPRGTPREDNAPTNMFVTRQLYLGCNNNATYSRNWAYRCRVLPSTVLISTVDNNFCPYMYDRIILGQAKTMSSLFFIEPGCTCFMLSPEFYSKLRWDDMICLDGYSLISVWTCLIAQKIF